MLRTNSRLHSDYSSAGMALWVWLALGVAAELLFPGLRSSDPRFGWLPFWFIVAPLIDLAIVRRCWLAQTSRALLIRMRRRRRPARPQAQRWSRRRTLRKVNRALPTDASAGERCPESPAV
jgi:hypothetical protein